MIAVGAILLAVAAVIVAYFTAAGAKSAIDAARAEVARLEEEVLQQRTRALAAERQVRIERAEVERLVKLSAKVEEINEKRIENIDKVSSPEPAVAFDNSIGVLSDLSSKRRS